MRRLLATPAGQIVLWNLFDGHREGLFQGNDLRRFSHWWRSALPSIDAAAPLPDGADPLFVTLDLLRLEPSHWRALWSTYPGLSALGEKPEFRLLCKRMTRHPGDGAMLLTTLTTEDLFIYLGADSRNELLAQAGLDTIGDGSRLHAVIRGTPQSIRADSLRPGKHLGRPGGILWYTTAGSVDAAIRRCDSDAVRDQLGLIHILADADLMAVTYSARKPTQRHTARPTAVDAGSNRRFKTRADRSRARRRSSWGHTAHLAQIATGASSCDGAPERVALPIPTDDLVDVQLRPIGRTSIRRGATSEDCDRVFNARLARRRAASVIARQLVRLL